MTQQLECISIDRLPTIAREILEKCGHRRIFAISGKMGAGKTTFIHHICRELGVTDPTSSPSFGLVNEYRTPSGEKIYHFDFYRIKSVEEAYNIGYEEYFYSGNYCLIEWPEKIQELLPQNCVYISINVEGAPEEIRMFEVNTEEKIP